MRSLLLAILTGAVGALALHIIIIFAVPFFAPNDAWSRIADLPASGRFFPADAIEPAGRNDALALGRRFTRAVACRFELDEAPVHVTAAGHVPFWSLGVFDQRANEIFSMNDRTAEGARLDVTLALPLQMVGLRQAVPPALASSVLVETQAVRGYLLLRTVIPDASWETAAEEFLDSAECGPVTG